MIFVTTGLHPDGFDRLVRAADEMGSFIEEPVVIQRGGTRYTPKFAQYFDFVNDGRMKEWLREARVVVSHGGAGSILHTLQAGKPLVVVPRLKRFGEVIDDHQLELAQALSQQGRAVVVVELSAEALWQAIGQITAPTMRLTGKTPANYGLQDTLRAWLAEQSTSRARWHWRPGWKR